MTTPLDRDRLELTQISGRTYPALISLEPLEVIAGEPGDDEDPLLVPTDGFVMIAAHGANFEGNVTWRLASDLALATREDPLHVRSTGGALGQVIDFYSNSDRHIYVLLEFGAAIEPIEILVWHASPVMIEPEPDPVPDPVPVPETSLDPARVTAMKEELADVRTAIRKAIPAANVGVPGVGLTYQSLSLLKEREAELTWQIQEYYNRGPFGQVILRNRPAGVITREALP